MRKHVERDSPILRTEPEGAVLLLIGPQSPCGSYCVYGGWVGGPGRETDVRLVSLQGDLLAAFFKFTVPGLFSFVLCALYCSLSFVFLLFKMCLLVLRKQGPLQRL